MISWRWSNGDAYYRSGRQTNVNQKGHVDVDNTLKYEESQSTNPNYNHSYNLATDSTVVNDCLSDDSFFTNSFLVHTRNEKENVSKREDIDSKLADREMVSQRGMNPFLDHAKTC
jgi:hypothetical protein